jgi:hypothetical protein
MRRVLLALLASTGLGASAQAMAGQIPPNMIYDCQQPQLTALSKELGRKVCVQYDMIKTMDTSTPAIEAAARESVGHATKIAASSDQNAITCRENDEAFRPPRLICARNSDWNQRWKRIGPENTAPYAPFASTDGRTPPVAPQ